MLNRLGLLSFFITCTLVDNVYANTAQAPVLAPAQTIATAAADSSATELTQAPEPTAFIPIELPPIAHETLAKSDANATIKTLAKPIPNTAVPVSNTAIPAPINREVVAKPTVIAIKKAPATKPKQPVIEVTAHPVNIETVAEPVQKVADATEKPVAAAQEAQQSFAENQPTESTSTPTYINAPATKPAYTPDHAAVDAPIVESSKAMVSQCANGSNNRLQKSLLVMAFPRLIPTSSSAGELYQVEQQLPQLLSELLVNKHSTITPIQLDQALPLPDATTDAQVSLLTQRLAARHRSQFILSGEVVDMSMTTPDATYNPGLYARAANAFFDFIEAKNRFDRRDRLFSFQLHLRDGFTGQELLTKRYNTYGLWGYTGKVGFGAPLFWKSDYGQQIKSLISTAAKDLSQTLNCQPFIAQIDSRPGQTQFILQSGANNGLHTGDMLELYQLIVQGSETRYQEQDVRLVNRNVAIELREVYASHSVGVINSSTYLTGQLLAVAH